MDLKEAYDALRTGVQRLAVHPDYAVAAEALRLVLARTVYTRPEPLASDIRDPDLQLLSDQLAAALLAQAVAETDAEVLREDAAKWKDAETQIFGLQSALNLRQVFTAQSNQREASALHNYAGAKVELRQLELQLATAISRGHLPTNFYAQLREWTK